MVQRCNDSECKAFRSAAFPLPSNVRTAVCALPVKASGFTRAPPATLPLVSDSSQGC